MTTEAQASERGWIRKAILVHLGALALFFTVFAGSFFRDCAQCGMEIIFILPVYFPAWFVTRSLVEPLTAFLDLSRMNARVLGVIIFWAVSTGQIYLMAKLFIGLGRRLSSLAQKRRKTAGGTTLEE